MTEFKLLIDGRLEDGDAVLEVVNPATEAVAAVCARASARQLEAAVNAARRAFPGWSATPILERRDALLKIADVLQQNVEELARLITEEQGKPLGDAQREVYGAAAFFRYFADLQISDEILEDQPGRKVVARRRPLGVVGCIVPWNFPVMLMAFKLPPALLAGNCVVLKPAATTPLSALRFGALVKDLLPPGVLNIIADANDLGPALTAHPSVAKISFTGSTATGRRVMAGAAETLKRVTLELGGNDAAIVLEDVDPKVAAPKIFSAAFQNAGQVCIAAKRIYVHDSIYEEMCAELAKLADATVVGDGLEQGVQMGPLQNRMQFEKVLGYLEAARRDGNVIAGGARVGDRGFFIRPTIVRDIEDGSPLVDEEQFGPVLPVIRFRDAEAALARANASEYGLGGSVWSGDMTRAWSLAERMQSGTVWINKHQELAPHLPFGGAKMSGIGIELGQSALAEFTQLQVINAAPAP